MKRKRHNEAEVAAKLQQASDLAAQGKSQPEIAKALGISVMTYHRWRKASGSESGFVPLQAGDSASQRSRISDLKMENARLRKLVTDLLLDKVRLEEILDRARMRNAG